MTVHKSFEQIATQQVLTSFHFSDIVNFSRTLSTLDIYPAH